MKIRRLEPKDAAQYREIRLEALQFHPAAFSSDYEDEKEHPVEFFENRLNFAHFFTFGAFVEKSLAGVVTLILENKVKERHKAHIVAMYVRPQERGAGIGRSLMIEAINKAIELKTIEQIHLSVTCGNEPAKRLYQSLGFQTYGTEKKALKMGNTYFDEELMVLAL